MNKKEIQLGMPFGTASHKLRKQVMFMLAKKCGMDLCCRCGQYIDTVEDFTLDHKQPWQDVDVSLFWDLDNIGFSHYVCNVGSARRPTKRTRKDKLAVRAACQRRRYWRLKALRNSCLA